MPTPRKRRSERTKKQDYVAPDYQKIWKGIYAERHETDLRAMLKRHNAKQLPVYALATPSSVEFLSAYTTYVDGTDAPVQARYWREMAIEGMIER